MVEAKRSRNAGAPQILLNFQKLIRRFHFSFTAKLANERRRRDAISDHDRRNNLCPIAVFSGQRTNQRRISAPVITERVILTSDDTRRYKAAL